MNRPFVSVVLAYAAGLLLAQLFHPPLTTLFVASFFILVLILILKNFRPVLIWPLLALTGWTNFAAHTITLAPDDLRTVIGAQPALTSVRGTLLETPSLRIYLRDAETVQRMVASVRVTAWREHDAWRSATGDIIVTTPGVLADYYFTGQSVEITGILARPDRPVAEGIFDYRSYLEKLGVYYSLKTGGTNDWSLGEKSLPRAPFSARFIAWAQRTLTLGLDPADETTARAAGQRRRRERH